MTGMPALTLVETALSERFGHQPQRASVSFLGVDRIEVLRFEPIPGERAYVSLGMARQAMTGAGDLMVAADGPRAELMLRLRDELDRHADIWRRVAVLAAAPAVEGVVYAPGMSVDLGQPLVPGSACTGVVVSEPSGWSIDTDVGSVEILEVTPATSTELAWCRVRGSAALRERWELAGTDLLDLERTAVTLT